MAPFQCAQVPGAVRLKYFGNETCSVSAGLPQQPVNAGAFSSDIALSTHVFFRPSPLCPPGSAHFQHQQENKFRTVPLTGPPFFFGKPADAIVDVSKQPAAIRYPGGTQLLHYEIEQARGTQDRILIMNNE